MAKKAQLADELHGGEQRIAEPRADIAALDRAVVFLGPDHVTTAAPPKPRRGEPLFSRGVLRASVLEAIVNRHHVL